MQATAMDQRPAPTTAANARRRQLLAAGAGLGATLLVRPSVAAPDDLASAIAAFAGGTAVQVGKVTLDVSTLVDNGNTVPVTVKVDSPMTAADHVKSVALFNERNPQREVFKAVLGPRAGRADVSTRIRLATTQKLVAIAQMSDGSVWSHTVDVVVTLAACIEGESP
jgi:sulfur-oxidizing protein SoxY